MHVIVKKKKKSAPKSHHAKSALGARAWILSRVCLGLRTNRDCALCMMPVAADQWEDSVEVCMTGVP